jgi:hypothetical protein
VVALTLAAGGGPRRVLAAASGAGLAAWQSWGAQGRAAKPLGVDVDGVLLYKELSCMGD